MSPLRPANMKEMYQHMGKESNRLEDVTFGLVHDKREALASYTDREQEIWERLIRPVLKEIPARWLMEQSSSAGGRSSD